MATSSFGRAAVTRVDVLPRPTLATRTRLLYATDIKLLVLAFLITAFTLAYPFGRDQGLFDVVGREWFRHGAVPYRDLVEQKPPPIYIIHGLLNLVFGDQMWGIRAFDLALTMAAGVAVACLGVPREARFPGLAGFSALTLTIFHYGFYGFWDTSQVDWTATAFAVIGLAFAVRLVDLRAVAIVGGLAIGIATLTKPTTATFGVIVVSVLVHRLRMSNRRSVYALMFAAAAAMPWALTLGWFAAHHALSDFYLWVVRVNGYYQQHERPFSALGDVLRAMLRAANVVAPLVQVTLFSVGARALFLPRPSPERRRGYLIGAMLVLAAVTSLVAQAKFYRYHASPCLFGLVLTLVLLVADLAEWCASERGVSRQRTLDIASAIAVCLTLAAPGSVSILELYPATLRHLIGELDDRSFARYFDLDKFDCEDTYLVGAEIRRRARPGDRLSVRGFEPQIYQIAGLSPATRFFWTQFITDPRRSMLEKQWLEEESQALQRSPPRFVVTIHPTKPVVGTTWQQERAPYVEVFHSGHYWLLELQR